jgi:hypothetical protein
MVAQTSNNGKYQHRSSKTGQQDKTASIHTKKKYISPTGSTEIRTHRAKQKEKQTSNSGTSKPDGTTETARDTQISQYSISNCKPDKQTKLASAQTPQQEKSQHRG